ncbi:MAG: hypothetical protein E6K05_05495 [Methanobacteriota archaeon]|nr:MAG: hypothetical protein E6K05_05495 [Euryarchaeota archaeon]
MKARLPGSDRYDCLVDEYEQVHMRSRDPPDRQGLEDIELIIGRIQTCSTRTMSCSAVSVWAVIVDSSIGLR